MATDKRGTGSLIVQLEQNNTDIQWPNSAVKMNKIDKNKQYKQIKI